MQVTDMGAVSGADERKLRTLASRRRAWALFDAGAPRDGRVKTQCRRCFIANDMQPVTSADLRRWAFAGQPRQQWMHWSLTRALRSLGARQIGRASGGARPAIWALNLSSPTPKARTTAT
jgi:hypothetical protein